MLRKKITVFAVEDFIIGELVLGHMLVKSLPCSVLRLAFLISEVIMIL